MEMFAYSPDALVFDAGSSTWSLRPDYDPSLHRVRLVISDDDAFVDGDWDLGEVGDDANQTADVFDPAGNLITSGQFYSEEYYTLENPDSSTFWLDRIEIGGVLVGYITSDPLDAGVTYPQLAVTNVGTPEQTGGTEERLAYTEAASVPCFGPDTMIPVEGGPRPVSEVRAGDRVWTLDSGLQPVVWTGATPLSALTPAARQAASPVLITPGALEVGVPERPVLLSPQHRVLVSSPRANLLFGLPRVFIAAKHLAGRADICRVPVAPDFAYHHLAFARHHAIDTSGVQSESLYVTARALELVGPAQSRALRRAMRPFGQHRRLAFPCLRSHEARALLAEPGRREAARA